MGARGKISFQAASEYHKGLLSVKTEVWVSLGRKLYKA